MPPESGVDVLIIGAGPAGLMCANALAMAGVNVRIIDKRPTKLATGQADGIQPRTTEVLQSYGLADRLLREGNQVHMYAIYNPGREGVELTTRVPNITPPASARYPFGVMLHQGGIEAIFHDSMRDYGVEVERARQPTAIDISDDINELSDMSSYPVKVTIASSDTTDKENLTEVVHAKFVVGADGAHSWVRKNLGIEMEGEQTDNIWSVVDMVPETNFPDIRNGCTVYSNNGSCLIIPRERDLVRFYIQLSEMDVLDPQTGRVDKNKVTPQDIVSVARQIFHPFEFGDPKEIDWWTIYAIGQRVASSYSVKDRVFIAGDACHTHSPKAGQGMNASMNDTHNLAWKLVQVLRGWASPSLLKTYEHERRRFAQDLINFDKKYVRLLSEKPRTVVNEDGVSNEDLWQTFDPATFEGFMSGVGIEYSPSVIVVPEYQKCASGLVIGRRMPPQIFVRAADIRPMEIQDLLPADLRFKVLFFVGNLNETRIAELNLLAEQLSKPSSFLRKYSPEENISTVFDIITITAGKKEVINFFLVPEFFRPHWSKVLLDDTDMTGSKGGRGYENYVVDPRQITLVVVRPDGYVGMVAPSTALEDLDKYFGSFLQSRHLSK